MELHQITLHYLQMKLKSPFTTSFGSILDRDCILVEMRDKDGVTGWGESVAFSAPWYTEETTKTTFHVMEDFLIPLLFEQKIDHPDEVERCFGKIRRNHMAKAALEGAVWDLFAQKSNTSLAIAIGGVRQTVEAGVAIGIQPMPKLIQQIEHYLAEGYKRIKVKIKPGQDRELLANIRRQFPDIPLMADANSAYTLDDTPLLKSLDEFNLMMIEQPLAADDILDHARLQEVLQTPICLDESIHSYEDARMALEHRSCRIINIKVGRVGGISAAKRIHDLCKENRIAVWCGGMLETGIGRAHNISLATLEQFILPGDISGSSRYWEKDIIEPEVEVDKGLIQVPERPGIGYEVNRHALEKVTLYKQSFYAP